MCHTCKVKRNPHYYKRSNCCCSLPVPPPAQKPGDSDSEDGCESFQRNFGATIKKCSGNEDSDDSDTDDEWCDSLGEGLGGPIKEEDGVVIKDEDNVERDGPLRKQQRVSTRVSARQQATEDATRVKQLETELLKADQCIFGYEENCLPKSIHKRMRTRVKERTIEFKQELRSAHTTLAFRCEKPGESGVSADTFRDTLKPFLLQICEISHMPSREALDVAIGLIIYLINFPFAALDEAEAGREPLDYPADLLLRRFINRKFDRVGNFGGDHWDAEPKWGNQLLQRLTDVAADLGARCIPSVFERSIKRLEKLEPPASIFNKI